MKLKRASETTHMESVRVKRASEEKVTRRTVWHSPTCCETYTYDDQGQLLSRIVRLDTTGVVNVEVEAPKRRTRKGRK